MVSMTTVNQTVMHGQVQLLAEGYINKAEVARRMQKQVRTVDNWMRRGILPYYKIGRSVAFKWSEIEKQLAMTCRVARPELN